ncbi:iron complex transport system ATP-binding protein [Thermoactinomyces sp. DSM 45891]|uniref:ABC transporter ATP-binding protein n=1 Tax=Thermoactinomyces sp. DSM 45891 TaxID=1761907 RepID=UPI00091FA317|nr:ABC transporter ATP-binding protein [Thermoactinomyces sp. DSM 45891]SFX01750.1 iron complex transport system ATP-binding protein [Thermoactinomyces sp. DSM 45891]
MSILRVENVEARYDGHVIFENLCLDVLEGKITTIIGPNGCGKSTLLKTMGRILKPKIGKVYLQEQDINTLPTQEIAKRLTLLPQNPLAPGELAVEELISYGRYPHRKNISKLTTEDQEKMEWAMEITHTLPYRNRPIGSLSGGQRQKVWLAMALAQDTTALLLDEPTTYLDLAHQLDVLQIVENLNQNHQCTVVMVLHDINHAARFSHEIVGMRDGKIMATGSPHELITVDILKQIFHIDARIMIDPFNGSPVCFGYESALAKEELELLKEKENIAT